MARKLWVQALGTFWVQVRVDVVRDFALKLIVLRRLIQMLRGEEEELLVVGSGRNARPG